MHHIVQVSAEHRRSLGTRVKPGSLARTLSALNSLSHISSLLVYIVLLWCLLWVWCEIGFFFSCMGYFIYSGYMSFILFIISKMFPQGYRLSFYFILPYIFAMLYSLVWFFVTKIGLEFRAIVLSQQPRYWSCRHEPTLFVVDSDAWSLYHVALAILELTMM